MYMYAGLHWVSTGFDGSENEGEEDDNLGLALCSNSPQFFLNQSLVQCSSHINFLRYGTGTRTSTLYRRVIHTHMDTHTVQK